MHRIMVVEDEVLISDQLEEYLRSAGYDVVGKAFTGEVSVDMARSLGPDLILMDIVMPGKLDGIDAAKVIKTELDIPIIFLTAYAEDEFIERAKKVEPLGYIVKPLQEKQLKAAIEIALFKKAAEEEIKGSLAGREMLLKELQHRVKSNLEVISSLLSLQSAYLKDKRDVELFKETRNRVVSMSLIHDRLCESRDLVSVDMSGYLRALTVYLFRSYQVNAADIKLRINPFRVFLGIDTARYCGLILNELVTNSIRHAFPEGRKGEISVDFASGDGEFTLTVSDDGVGMPEGTDFRDTKTLGFLLVVILAEDQLRGQLSLDRTKGTKFQVRFPVRK